MEGVRAFLGFLASSPVVWMFLLFLGAVGVPRFLDWRTQKDFQQKFPKLKVTPEAIKKAFGGRHSRPWMPWFYLSWWVLSLAGWEYLSLHADWRVGVSSGLLWLPLRLAAGFFLAAAVGLVTDPHLASGAGEC